MTIAFRQNCLFVLILIFATVTSIFFYREVHQNWILFKKAESQYEKKNFAEAIKLYEKSLEGGFPRSKMSVDYANSYLALGQFNKAIPLYKEYLSYHPKDHNARLDLAKALSWIGNTKEAEMEYKKILDLLHN